jgi:hypothetical protein
MRGAKAAALLLRNLETRLNPADHDAEFVFRPLQGSLE